jgi:hypothetical protein
MVVPPMVLLDPEMTSPGDEPLVKSPLIWLLLPAT